MRFLLKDIFIKILKTTFCLNNFDVICPLPVLFNSFNEGTGKICFT